MAAGCGAWTWTRLVFREPIGAGLIPSVALNAQRRYRGDKPSELPIVQPTKLETAINLKTASDLGIALSPSLLARADEVIE
jgi:putative tryptophan/tyrosine transport system substrate-binding protein